MKGDVKLSNRTVWFTGYLAALMVAAAWLLKDSPEVVKWTLLGLAFLAIPPAARHMVGDLAMGGGIKGAARVLMTDAKPGEEAKP